MSYCVFRIKALSSKRPRHGHSLPAASNMSFAPFNSIDPNVVSSTSASQPPAFGNGFSFGQSQSFPGASSMQNGNQTISFGSGNPSAFDFSAPVNSGSSFSNPFAHMSDGQANQTPVSGFDGFRGQMFNVPASVSSHQSQPAMTAPSTGVLFGSQPETNSGTTVFGGLEGKKPESSVPATSTSSIFGKPATQDPGPVSTPFNSKTAGTTSVFSRPSLLGGADDMEISSAKSSPGTFANNSSLFSASPSKQLFGNVNSTLTNVSTPGVAAAVSSPVSLFKMASSQDSLAVSESPAVTESLAASSVPSAPKFLFPSNGSSTTTQSTFNPFSGNIPSSGASTLNNIFAQKPASIEAPGTMQTTQANPICNSLAQTSAQITADELHPPPSEAIKASASETSEAIKASASKASEAIKGADPISSMTESVLISGQPSDATPLAKPQEPQPKSEMEPNLKFGGCKPRLPSDLDPNLSKSADTVFNVRVLNTCLQRRIMELDPSIHDFDSTILFYVEFRKCLNAPIGGMLTTKSAKRKTREDEADGREVNGLSHKKSKPNEPPVTNNISSPDQNKEALATSVASNKNPTSNKRKAYVEDDIDSPPGKRAKDADAPRSVTAGIFASAFSGSKIPSAQGESSTEISDKSPVPPPKFVVNASTSRLEPSKEVSDKSPVPPPKFVVNASTSGTGKSLDFFSQFKQKAEADAVKEKAKRKAEEFDSDEDDEAEWERKDAEAQRKKREKIETVAKKRAKYVVGKGFVFDDSADETSADAKAVNKSPTPAKSKPKTHLSIFQNSQEQLAVDPKNPFSHLSASNSEADVEGDTSDGDGSEANVKQSHASNGIEINGNGGPSDDRASTPLQVSTPTGGRSLFDRLEYDRDGKPKRHVLAEEKKEGPDPMSFLNKSKFASFNAPGSASSSIFNPSTAPQTASATQITGTRSQQSSIGHLFGAPSQPAVARLVADSIAPSRSSTPITSDTGADDSADGEPTQADPQLDLTRGGTGEEDEEVMFESRGRALKLVSEKWESQGIGLLRILKHKTTSRARILLRTQPSGKVVLNTTIMREINYTLMGSAVQFLVPHSDEAPDRWAVRVKMEDAERLMTSIEASKA